MSNLPAKTLNMEAYPLSFWAKRYNVCERKLRNDIAAGKLQCIRFGRAIRVSPEQMQEYVSSCLEA